MGQQFLHSISFLYLNFFFFFADAAVAARPPDGCVEKRNASVATDRIIGSFFRSEFLDDDDDGWISEELSLGDILNPAGRGNGRRSRRKPRARTPRNRRRNRVLLAGPPSFIGGRYGFFFFYRGLPSLRFHLPGVPGLVFTFSKTR